MKIASLALLAFLGSSPLVGCAASTSDDSLEAAVADGKADGASGPRFTKKATPTNPRLAALASDLSRYGDDFSGTYRFNRPTTERTSAVARTKRIKEVMYRYQCSFFDESIDITRPTGTTASKAEQVVSDLDLDSNATDFDVDSFTTAIGPVVGDAKLDLLSGSASGNNTIGEVMGVYDLTNHEVYFYGFTNCGSDN